MNESLLNTREAAERLKLSRSTMAKWRITGEGPPFVKAGAAVRYRVTDIEAWAQAQLRISTSGCRKGA